MLTPPGVLPPCAAAAEVMLTAMKQWQEVSSAVHQLEERVEGRSHEEYVHHPEYLILMEIAIFYIPLQPSLECVPHGWKSHEHCTMTTRHRRTRDTSDERGACDGVLRSRAQRGPKVNKIHISHKPPPLSPSPVMPGGYGPRPSVRPAAVLGRLGDSRRWESWRLGAGCWCW
jgi:hypothetical protein